MTEALTNTLQPQRLPAALQRVYDSITLGFSTLGMLTILALMILICADVFARSLFDFPIRAANELIGYFIVSAFFLQLPRSLGQGRVARAELIIDPLKLNKPFAGFLLDAIYFLLTALVCYLIADGVTDGALTAYQDGEISGVPGDFTFQIWPFKFVIVLGAAISFVACLTLTVRSALTAFSSDALGCPKGWLALGFIVLAVVAILMVPSAIELSRNGIGILMIASLVFFVIFGAPISTALILASIIGIWLMKGTPILGIRALVLASSEYLASYYFAVVPLFVMMGLIVSESDIGKNTFDVVRHLTKRLTAGLGIATIGANAVFAAITGSSIASAAVFSKIAAPELMRHGYTPRFAVGVVAGSSVLGMLIPPSILLIVFGFLAEASVGKLFIAAILPGILLALSFCVGLLVIAKFWPSFLGDPDHDDSEESENLHSSFYKVAPIIGLMILVIGGIYAGFFTPTESGAIGALGALIIAIAQRKMNVVKFWKVVRETGHVTVTVLFLILAANLFSRFIALSGIPQNLTSFIEHADLTLIAFTLIYVALLVALGMILDSVSIMLIVVPLALPLVQALGGDVIWFGIVTVVAVEVGLLTPPVGLTCFVVKSSMADPRITLRSVFEGAFPFALIMLIVIGILIAFPQISLLLI